MILSTLIYKIKSRLWCNLVKRTRTKRYYPQLYKAYWYARFCKSKEAVGVNYLTAIPNRGAGIGHQMANWIAGYWFAEQFGLQFSHCPFSSLEWEEFLGFGKDEIHLSQLVEKQGYKKVRLPLFNEKNARELAQIQKIVKSYKHQNIVFVCEQDQFYRDQFGVMSTIKKKFYNASFDKKNNLLYSENSYNIAIHVRRGDIVSGQETKNPNLLMRWQDKAYFENVLTAVLAKLQSRKPIAIYLFSQGALEDFKEFDHFENINYCLEMNAQDSFLHMVYADLLITSKSSFSYKPALLSNGLKICPANFWHGYPIAKDWILADEQGGFNDTAFDLLINSKSPIA